MTENHFEQISNKYIQYIGVLIREREILGDNLCDCLSDIPNEQAKQFEERYRKRILELDIQIKEIIFPNAFKKKLITEKSE